MLLVHYNYILCIFFQHMLSNIKKKCSINFAFPLCDVGSVVSLTLRLFIALRWKNRMNRELRITNCSSVNHPSVWEH